MSTNAAAFLTVVAFAAGWFTARVRRAGQDLAGAKDGVTKAKKALTIERKPFLVVAAIVFFAAWWWMHKHGG